MTSAAEPRGTGPRMTAAGVAARAVVRDGAHPTAGTTPSAMRDAWATSAPRRVRRPRLPVEVAEVTPPEPPPERSTTRSPKDPRSRLVRKDSHV